MTGKSSPNILLVDDDPLIRLLGQELLEHQGYRVATAADGPTALRLLEQLARVDLVLLDYYLPGLTGAQVLQRIKDSRPDLPVLIASGFASLSEEARLMELGAWRVIHKPFRWEELGSLVQAALAQSPAA